MKKEEMVVGRLYFTQEIGMNGYEYVGHVQAVETAGSFKDSNGVHRRLYYSSMLEPRLVFEFNDEIEISCNENFTDTPTKGKFKNLDPEGNYWLADENGFMVFAEYARKVEPMVEVWVVTHNFDGGTKRTRCSITKELADNILAGDV
jgi:hypothetical protein